MHFSLLFIKLVAIIAMTIDHIAWVWVDTQSFLGQFLHFIGRLTAPLMCFLLVEGFYKTKKYSSYLIRVFIFALIAQYPFIAMLYGLNFFETQPDLIWSRGNVLFNFLLALFTLGLIYKTTLNLYIKFLGVLLLLLFSVQLDWGVFIIAFCLVFAHFRQDRNQQIIAYIITAMGLLLMVDVGIIYALPPLSAQWMPLGILVVPFFLKYCNDQLGARFGGRYFFYVFYPLHMLIISIIAFGF